MTPYGKVYNKNTISSGKNYSKIEGVAYAKSDDVRTIRDLAKGLPNCVSSGNTIVYNIHNRLEKERK